MFEKLVTALEPFGFTVIILAGATLAGWVKFTNSYVVGVAAVSFGILLVIKHIVLQVHNQKPTNKKGN
ncbi:phosphoinositide-interacting protein family [Caudoviricetes sp.]|nr:phosphoinositide-interacting protein family [Caudoviricetes sp.]